MTDDRPLKVLVVDDEALARQAAVEYLAGCEGVDGQLVEFDRTELQRTVLGPGDVANAASPDIAAGPPDFQRRRPVRLQRYPQVARIVVHRRGIAETEDGEHVIAIQYL